MTGPNPCVAGGIEMGVQIQITAKPAADQSGREGLQRTALERSGNAQLGQAWGAGGYWG